MKAEQGDELTIRGRREGDEERHGQILEVLGHDGAPPYLVRWLDSRESVFFPAADTVIEHRQRSDA